MDAAAIAAELASIDQDDYEGLWPEHVEAVNAFLVASTQWRVVAGLSRLVTLGLDYVGAKAGIEAAGITITPPLWSALRVMEIAACAELNEPDQ